MVYTRPGHCRRSLNHTHYIGFWHRRMFFQFHTPYILFHLWRLGKNLLYMPNIHHYDYQIYRCHTFHTSWHLRSMLFCPMYIDGIG